MFYSTSDAQQRCLAAKFRPESPMTLHPFPSGWYPLALSEELAPGAVKTRWFMGEEVVVFRGEAGGVCVADATCPHLGAHLGHGGTVVGETLRCPFHHFRFDLEGRCVHTPYAGKAPPTARLGTRPSMERNGLVLAWHGAVGEAPSWEVPVIDFEGYTGFKVHSWKLSAHPQDTAENSVDVGHFTTVHGFLKADVRGEPRVEGPVFRIDYSAALPGAAYGMSRPVAFDFDIAIYGLGVSVVDTRVPELGITTRQYVLATPLDGREMELRGVMAMRRMPNAKMTEQLHEMSFRGFVEGIAQDLPIWGHRRFLDRPALAAGDGPIGLFRKWARQFQPGPDGVAASAAAA